MLEANEEAGESGPYVDIRDSQQYEEVKIGGQGDEAYFWTADAAVDRECYGRFLTYNSGDIQRGVWFRGGGNAVRCIKDPE
ncbi:MAG TPA: hypothetical protein DC042_18685 [Bacteroidales bacterium]|nr:hypothetical protein [Bacteroidales bacterium]